MGLETDITDIQSLNRNWPPVSDPRAQGADHIRNIKKAIQLTFPNLKQCLLNDAQFTALGTLIGDGSGTFTINGKLTVSGALTVPTVTDWTTQQAVGAKDAEGRYLKPGDADGRYAHDGSAFNIGDNTNKYNSNILYGNSYRLSFQNDENMVLYDTSSNSVIFQLSKDSIAWKGNALALMGDLNTEITNRTNADASLQSSKANLNGGNSYTGGQSIYNAPVVVHNAPTLTSGSWNYSPALIARTDSRAGVQIFAQDQVDNGASVVLTYEWNAAPQVYWWFQSDGNINNSARGQVAFKSDLPRTFISAQQVVQTNYKYVIPHNLGRVPDAFWVYLVNVSSDWGYNPGQIAIPSFDDKSNGGFGPLPVNADSWNIFLPMSDAVPLVSRMDPSNGDNQLGDRHSINADGWRFVFYAVCIRG